ncbi:MAG TPA: 50S ribosomal protein L17 [Thermoanaerobaculia bacterium]|jgi:large subunit ribosomal protein L17|nr:50S ribosomal protein L17 [Thermoanaerobaculia bacterium]
MRHAQRGRKLGRTTSHRLAMFRNQLTSLVIHERIVTTLPKAKELRPLAEKLVTRGKAGSVADRRQVARVLHDREHVKKLFDDISPRFADRAGGYLRIVKLGPRQGDGAETAALQFVDYDPDRGAPAPEADDKKAKGKAKGADKGDEKDKTAEKGKAGRKARAAAETRAPKSKAPKSKPPAKGSPEPKGKAKGKAKSEKSGDR